jgi:hypothetical protein
MDPAEKERMEKLAVNSAISEALTVNGARAVKVLQPHVRAACRVSWVEGVPVVTATQNGTDEISVESFVAAMKFDKDFAPNFYKPPDPRRPDEDGIRRISVMDQENLNRYSAEIASGEAVVVYDEPARKKLDETEIDLRDQASLDANLEAIASGEKTVRV